MNVVFDFGAVLFTWRPLDLVAECFPDRAGDSCAGWALGARGVWSCRLAGL